ncbi:MAG: type III pantothenate kinase, partial [Candidatus Omnitrophica bacterium]|nr:type III pantothenate kinase [Candidatus Omnitrophota bacterium]
MIIAIDIGNTNIAVGLFDTGKLIRKYSIPTKANEYYPYLREIVLKNKASTGIICSVVPQATQRLTGSLKKLGFKGIKTCGVNQKIPIKNLYRYPGQVGQDRLVNAYAAVRLYQAPAIIIDFGTAITFDVVTAKKEYKGGMIIPGLGISLETLAEKTALLPKIKLNRPSELIGRDTRNSILSGVIYGYSALTDGLISKLKAELKTNPIVISTGGNIDLIAGYCRQIDKIDINLT